MSRSGGKKSPVSWSSPQFSPSLQQLRLIYANSNTRALTSAELSEQAVQVEKLLYQLKEEGYEFPGRMRDHVAKAVNASTTKLAKLKVIREGLAKCWTKDYKSGALSESTAYEMARLSPEDQQCIFDAIKATGANIRWLYADDVKTYAKRLAAVAKLKCKTSGISCGNIAGKRLATIKKERYYNSPCGQCCAKCDSLTSCKNACPQLADKIKQLKAEKRDANRQAKLAKAEEDRPVIEYIQKVYRRVADARKAAGLNVQALYKAAGKNWWSEKDKEQKDLEAGKTQIKTDTILPLGRSFYYGDAKSLCGVADALGCSVDYLLCRTDIPEMAQAESQPPAEGWLPLQWLPGAEKPQERCTAVAHFALDDEAKKTTAIIAVWNGEKWCFKHGADIDSPCVKWFPLPDE